MPPEPDMPVLLRAAPSALWLKERIDRYAGLCALVLCGPLLLILMWLVRRDSPGPALFSQARAGRHARSFRLHKLRTMRVDVDPFGDSPQSGDDPRVTRLGRWLRETSLDELPQLLNVVRGEMSLVGPRPLYVQQISEWSARHRARLLVRPGLTGLAQINGRGSLSLEEKLEWDVRYVEACGPRTDLGIMLHTVRALWARTGIYEVRYSAQRARRGESGVERGAAP